jgi:predicted glycoside hydrolase/deacetylase ChbG (UPF0249 family)
VRATGEDDRDIQLIVSADDFGYFRCVSAGIVHAHQHGMVTATAVLANAEGFRQDAALLKTCPDLDIGVHLNLTTGVPLSDRLGSLCRASGGRLPSKFVMLKWLLAGQLTEADVETEWRMQIQETLDAGLTPRFLNSHEHVHMMPRALPAAKRLAREFGIRHLRVPSPTHLSFWPPGAFVRDLALGALAWRGRAGGENSPAKFVGLGASGRLTAGVLRSCFAAMKPGTVYELMCHPGFHDVAEVKDSRLLAYHDWEGEVRALTDTALQQWMREMSIRLVSYRDLDEQRRQ